MGEESQTLCERVTILHYAYIHCLFLSEEKERSYLHLLMFTKQAAVYSSFLFKRQLLS
jgi:hypothetical protein